MREEIVIWFCLLIGTIRQVYCGCNQTDLFSQIFPKNYKKSEAPRNNGKPVDVYTAIQIFDIYDLNERTMDFYIHMYFDDFWQDSRLSFDCLHSDTPIIIPESVQKEMWTPDIYFENSKSGKLFMLTLPNINIKVLPDGFLYRYARYVLRISCQMDLHYYPIDIQVCTVRIALFAYSDDVVRLHWLHEPGGPSFSKTSIYFMSQVELPQFLLVNWTTGKETAEWNTGNYTTLLAIFKLDRLITAHLINTYIPSTLVVMLSWLSFWLDVSAVPARVTLGVTSLLTLATQVVQCRKSLPPVAYVNALDLWLFVCVNMVFSTLVEYALCYYFTNYSVSKQDGGRFIFWKPKFTNVQIIRGENANPRKAWIKCDKITKEGSGKTTKETKEVTMKVQPIDKISRILFPSIFMTFALIYWVYFLVIIQNN